MLYIVTQSPKGKHRQFMSTPVMIVDVATAAAAVRHAVETKPDEFGPSKDYSKPKAELLELGAAYLF